MCGVGMVVDIEGRSSRALVEMGIQALGSIWHRGAKDADGKTGDGAGIHLQIPQEFFRDHVARTTHARLSASKLAVGMIFLPRKDFAAQERCRSIVETEVLRFGYNICGWRQVPIDARVIGEKAKATRPEIEQIVIENKGGKSEPEFETDLFIIRRRIERTVLSEQILDFYVCSLSCRSIIYKGMFLAEQLTSFYPDLLDASFESNFALFHQRYSTNTFPNWNLAHPFRILAHNGEINTLRGNLNWMKAHESRMSSPVFGDNMKELIPIVQPGGSDSAALDNVFELLVRAGRPLPMVKLMTIPDTWSQRPAVPQAHRDLYEYLNSVMEPWDGPAAIVAYDKPWVIAGMDRNGLRPLRYSITKDQKLIVGSETGMIKVPEEDVVEKGRVGPGQLIAVNLNEKRFYRDSEIKDHLAGSRAFGEWIGEVKLLQHLNGAAAETTSLGFDEDTLRRRQVAVGWTMEDLEMILRPMAIEAKEAVGSMGDDTPLAVLSDQYRGLHHFFRQKFAQVTNPPIDSLRERQVMSLKTRLRNLGNILDENREQCRHVQLESPVLFTREFHELLADAGRGACTIDCTFEPKEGHELRSEIERIQKEAAAAVKAGCEHIVLTDEKTGPGRVPMPMILAVGAVHTHLVKSRLRTFTTINVRSAECLDVHYFAVLIGVGATTVNPYLAEETIAHMQRSGAWGPGADKGLENYRKSVDDGLLKIMSKLGISVISSYRGGYNFETLGLSRSLVEEYFPEMQSRVSGIGLPGIRKKVVEIHQKAFGSSRPVMAVGGFYRQRTIGEYHSLNDKMIHTLQTAVAKNSYKIYRQFAEMTRDRPPVALRDLLDFKWPESGVPIEDVESVTEIRKRFVSPGMSIGALSREAHETLAVAMNRIGAKSCSGEGGEDPARYKAGPSGDNANSVIKQIASGRFGVTTGYLNNCKEIEIKVSQGAKPGEGGQLPGFKVTAEIAKLRHSTEGVTLISPPPHHDIYSIEDLSQLIYDLKQVNPEARVGVKLVARSGIGTIAAGVVKAMADVITISGHSGGTGASPQSSIKYAGIPWEMGLAETHQVLSLNGLRDRVRLRTDGGLVTGRDIVMAAILGAEEFSIGTASLIAMGCLMVRQCHSNTCPVGICTQDPALRARFKGSPEKVVNYFTFIAEDVRQILSLLGIKSLRDVVGRTDLLVQINRGGEHLDDLDLNPILARADFGEGAQTCTLNGRSEVTESLDAQIIQDARQALENGEKMQLAYSVRNTHRAVGARFSAAIYRRFGNAALKPDHFTIRLRGSAGQSLGAFAVQGLKLDVFGDANDYVGKGLSGGLIVVRPYASSPLQTHRNSIIGNAVLYGATSGKLFAAGVAGDRFAVRNSGAHSVIEGCGSNGCEYMTGGYAVILGAVGDNFAAGMTGGTAFVFDEDGSFEKRVNPGSVQCRRISAATAPAILIDLLEEHLSQTDSPRARFILESWEELAERFWQVTPPHPVAVKRPELRMASVAPISSQ